MFETKSEDEQCPGESNCDIFEAAAGENREEKLFNSCRDCPLLATKVQSSDESDCLRNNADFIERLRTEQRAGKHIDLDNIRSLAWEGLIVFVEMETNYERARESQLLAMFQALLPRR
jgi:hypothetical protein